MEQASCLFLPEEYTTLSTLRATRVIDIDLTLILSLKRRGELVEQASCLFLPEEYTTLRARWGYLLKCRGDPSFDFAQDGELVLRQGSAR